MAKQSLYFLVNTNLESYYISNGAVLTSIRPIPLNSNPIGWDQVKTSFATKIKYWTLTQGFTVPLKFVNDGAEIIREYQYNQAGYESKISVVILSLNTVTGVHELEYQGELDFSTFDDDIINGVTINSKEGGLLTYLNANDGVTYELQCNPLNPDAIKVFFDGITLFDKLNYISFTTDAPVVTYTTHAVPVVFSNNEGDSVGVIWGGQTYDEINNAIGVPLSSMKIYANASGNYLFSSIKAITGANIKGSVTVFTPTNNRRYKLYLVLSGNISYTLEPGTAIVNIVGGTYTTFSFDQTFDIPAGAKVFLLATWDGTSAGDISYIESKFSLTYSTINDTSYSVALKPLPILQQLVSLMTDGNYRADSNFFATHDNLVLTSGEALRELKNINGRLNGVLKLSFQDFFKDYNTDYNLGVKVVNDVLWIEPKEDLYNDTSTIFDLGKVSNISIKVADSYLFNQVKVGSNKQDYDERNGRYEFMGTQIYKVPTTQKGEYDLVAPFRRDGYGMDFIRGKLNKKDTTDNAGDNQCFKVDIGNELSVDTTQVFSTDTKTYYSQANVKFDNVLGNDIQFEVNHTRIRYTGFTDSGLGIFVSLKIQNVGGLLITVAVLVNGISVGTNIILANGTLQTFSITTPINYFDFVELYCDQVSYTGDFTVELPALVFTPSASKRYELNRPAYSSITGVPTNTVFNTEISPKHQLKAHYNYLNSILYQLQAATVTFQTSDRNKDLVTVLSGVTTAESSDVLVSSLPSPLFLPYVIECDYRLPLTFAQTMSQMVAGHIKMNYKGIDIWLLPIGEMSANTLKRKSDTLKFLASPLTNISDLKQLSNGGVYTYDMPNPYNIQIALNNTGATQEAVITFSSVPASATILKVQYRASGTSPWLGATNFGITSPQTYSALPLGSIDLLLTFKDNTIVYYTWDTSLSTRIFATDVNPVHWVKYDYQKPSKFQLDDEYLDRFENRQSQFDGKTKYFQKWQIDDGSIDLQFLCKGIQTDLNVDVYDSKGSFVQSYQCYIQSDSAVKAPFALYQTEIDLSILPEDCYQFVVTGNNQKMLISEWQDLRARHDRTIRIKYYNTYNKFEGYFTHWQPSIRVEGFKPQPEPDSTFESYQDEPADLEILSGQDWLKYSVTFGNGNGLPDFMVIKLNKISLLDNVKYDGTSYTMVEKLVKVEDVTGYPMNDYKIVLRRSINNQGISVDGNSDFTGSSSIYFVDGTVFNQGGIIEIDPE